MNFLAAITLICRPNSSPPALQTCRPSVRRITPQKGWIMPPQVTAAPVIAQAPTGVTTFVPRKSLLRPTFSSIGLVISAACPPTYALAFAMKKQMSHQPPKAFCTTKQCGLHRVRKSSFCPPKMLMAIPSKALRTLQHRMTCSYPALTLTSSSSKTSLLGRLTAKPLLALITMTSRAG